tara:strand:+ start:2015 stop:2341 length:327 start_codon:yes stop_codon:yes gene_type:complete
MAKTKTPAEEVAEAVEEVTAPDMTEMESPAEGSQEPESIGLQDLQLLAQIVDLASQRGAFKGNELTQVGAVYDKLSTFLSYVNEANAAKEAAEAETAEAQTEAPAEGE